MRRKDVVFQSNLQSGATISSNCTTTEATEGFIQRVLDDHYKNVLVPKYTRLGALVIVLTSKFYERYLM